MYPAHLFALFPPFPREDTIFIAMSFAERFRARWENVIQPAVRRIAIAGRALEPVRVDNRRIADSILTEILQGIRSSRLVFADVTSIGHLEGRPVRNGNVMYEVGIAQAVRLPPEVILFRSDNDELPFDVTNIRVNSYSPEAQPGEACETLVASFLEGLRETELQRHLAVEQAAQSVDATGCQVLLLAGRGVLQHPREQTMRDMVAQLYQRAAISRLLEMGLLRTRFTAVNVQYELTEFGIVVAGKINNRAAAARQD